MRETQFTQICVSEAPTVPTVSGQRRATWRRGVRHPPWRVRAPLPVECSPGPEGGRVVFSGGIKREPRKSIEKTEIKTKKSTQSTLRCLGKHTDQRTDRELAMAPDARCALNRFHKTFPKASTKYTRTPDVSATSSSETNTSVNALSSGFVLSM